MGNKTSNASVRHPSLGDVARFTLKDKPVIEAAVPVVDELEALKFQEGLKKGRSFKNGFLYLPVNHSFKRSISGMVCSQNELITVQFDEFLNNLQNEIQQRSLKGQHFQTHELWRILYILLLSAKDFQQEGVKMGNIHPQNILLKGDSLQQIKLVNRFSWPHPIGVQKVLEQSGGSYICKQIEQLSKKKIYEVDVRDNGGSDAFGSGMVILEMGTLLSSQSIYDFYNSKIKKDILDQRLKQFSDINNDHQLTSVLVDLLADESKRPSVAVAWSMLQPYEHQIMSGRPFKLDRARSKQSIERYQSLRN